jgi:hypothetical protein
MRAPVHRLWTAGLLLTLLGCAEPAPCGQAVWQTSQWLGQGVVVRCVGWKPLPHCRRGREGMANSLAWSCWASVNESEESNNTFQISEE